MNKKTVTDYENRYKSEGFYWGIAPNTMCYEVMRIKRAPDSEESEHYWSSGELFSYYPDWLFHKTLTEFIFDCDSYGIPHKHCIDMIIAENYIASASTDGVDSPPEDI